MDSVILYLYICTPIRYYEKKDHNAVPDSVLTKEFLSQFKTEDDVSKFLTKLYAQVLEKILEGVQFVLCPIDVACLGCITLLSSDGPRYSAGRGSPCAPWPSA